MPGLYALRSSSSSVAPKPSFHRHGTCRPPPPPSSSSDALARPPPLPAFHSSSTNFMAGAACSAASAQPIRLQHPDPCAEIVQLACLYGTSTLNYSSSGSPHDPSTVCLAAMVHEFLEEEVGVGSCGRARCNCVDGVCSDNETCIPDEVEGPQLPDGQLCEILEGITSCTSKPELLLLVDVARAMEAEMEEMTDGEDGCVNMECLRRPVMKRLRQEGYNAAICKSKWKHGDGLPAGDYEYIDVLVECQNGKKTDRFIVDIDFKAQFEIARASQHYTRLLEVLPRLYVGRSERLKQILKIMSNAAKRSLKEQGLLLPPWRKYKYLQAKWLSSYRRTTNSDTSRLQNPYQFLGLGFRGPTISLDFTKEMDLLYYRARAKGVGGNQDHNIQAHYHHHQRDFCLRNTHDMVVSRADVRTGFANELTDDFPGHHRDVCTAMCTEWQLPALEENEKCARGIVSGLSTALRHASASIIHERASLVF